MEDRFTSIDHKFSQFSSVSASPVSISNVPPELSTLS